MVYPVLRGMDFIQDNFLFFLIRKISNRMVIDVTYY